MPTIKVVNMAGAPVGEMTLSDRVFAADVKGAVLHAAVRAYLANQRQGTQSTLTRTEVSGGGKKPWKQKGTGRARQGSTRAPQWTHGGIALGPKPRSYRMKINKKLRRAAIFGALTDKLTSENMIVVDAITAADYKTKTMANMLSAVGAGKKSLVVLENNDEKTVLSFANISAAKATQYNTINVYDIMNADKIVFAKGALEKIEEVYAQ